MFCAPTSSHSLHASHYQKSCIIKAQDRITSNLQYSAEISWNVTGTNCCKPPLSMALVTYPAEGQLDWVLWVSRTIRQMPKGCTSWRISWNGSKRLERQEKHQNVRSKIFVSIQYIRLLKKSKFQNGNLVAFSANTSAGFVASTPEHSETDRR